MPASGSPVGSTPFGTSTPVNAPDPPTAGPALARYINPGTGDYELDTDVGQLASMPAVRQRMMLIGLTEHGSSATLPDLGIIVPKKIDEAFENKLRVAIMRAYRQLTDKERSVRIDGISIEDSGVMGRRTITISYTDLTTLNEADRSKQLEIPIA
jgi:phage baseplate assembly protein W